MTTEAIEEKIKFTGVQSEIVTKTWPYVENLVEKGLTMEQGLYKKDDIYSLLLQKKMQLWVAIDSEENKIVAVAVTQLAEYPSGKVCWVVLVAGFGIDDWVRFVTVIKLWAKSSGCSKLLSYSRDGWIRKMKPFGFKKLRTLIGCSLEDEDENLQ